MEQLSSVVVVGGGAVGLTAALALARRSVPVTVLEAAPQLVEEYRASTFHPPTLEMLDDLGLAQGMLAKGLIAHTFQYRDRAEGLVAEFDFGLLKNDTRFPFRLQLEQYALSVAAYEELSRVPGASVRFGHEVTGVRMDGDCVVLEVTTEAGAQEISAPYAIGADGATSAVRRSLGIAFDGMTYPERYLVLFTTFDFAEHMGDLAYVNYVSDPEQWFVLLRTPGVWRVLFPTDAEHTDIELEVDAVSQEHLKRVVPSDQDYPILHRMLYRVHQRVADTYRMGRVLLAGDAAHVNNPLGGMGLNGGIHDAVSLANALGDVWHGRAREQALDEHSERRRRIAIDYVQAWTHQNAVAIAQSDPAARRLQQDELRATAADPERARRYLLRTSMIEALRGAAR
jgi:3-(3-hydroxy-phenyl)propionate hydroxylase